RPFLEISRLTRSVTERGLGVTALLLEGVVTGVEAMAAAGKVGDAVGIFYDSDRLGIEGIGEHGGSSIEVIEGNETTTKGAVDFVGESTTSRLSQVWQDT